MAGNNDVLCIRNQLVQLGQLTVVEDLDIHLKEFIRIHALVDELLDAGDSGVTIGCVGNTKPFRRGVEHLDGSCAIVDELVDHQRDEELGLKVLHVFRVAEELLELGLGVLEVVGKNYPKLSTLKEQSFYYAHITVGQRI